MDVVLIRHAAALEESVERGDPYRALTAHGREQAKVLGEKLHRQGCTPTHIWTSHIVRAVQTAELVARGLAPELVLEVFSALAPGAPLKAVKGVVAALAALPKDAVVVLVGHEPGLSGLGQLLIARELHRVSRAEAVRINDGKLCWRFPWDADAPMTAP